MPDETPIPENENENAEQQAKTETQAPDRNSESSADSEVTEKPAETVDEEVQDDGGESAGSDSTMATVQERGAEVTHVPDSSSPMDQATLNKLVRGRMVLHYAARDVTIEVMDGDSALRSLSICTGLLPRRYLEDLLNPLAADARNGWLAFDPDVLAASWIPGSEAPPSRKATVDPAPLGTAA